MRAVLLSIFLAALVSLVAIPPLASALTFTRPLAFGSSGTDVSALQQYLQTQGYFHYPDITGYSLRRALSEYVKHYHAERNHQGKGNVLLFPRMWTFVTRHAAPPNLPKSVTHPPCPAIRNLRTEEGFGVLVQPIEPPAAQFIGVNFYKRLPRHLCVPKIRFCNIGGEGHRELDMP